MSSTSASGAAWYVDTAVPSSGDGKTWGIALETNQEGIEASSDHDTVITAQGTYAENIPFKGENIVLTSADPLNPGIVAGTAIDGGKTTGSVVTFFGTEGETCVLAGFTIPNGQDPSGRGIRSNLTHATIERNVISGNTAPGYGHVGDGLLGCDGIIHNNVITGNTAPYGSGAGHADRYGTIRNNLIVGNSGTWGAGLCWRDGTVRQMASGISAGVHSNETGLRRVLGLRQPERESPLPH